MDLLMSNDTGLVQQKEKIEETLGHALILIKIMEAFEDGKNTPQKVLYINEEKIFEFIKTIIIGYKVQGKYLFDSCYIQKNETVKRKSNRNFKELIKDF